MNSEAVAETALRRCSRRFQQRLAGDCALLELARDDA